jgi:hypothetical protein
VLETITRFTFVGGDVDGLAYAASDDGFTVSPTADGEGLILSTTLIVDELRWPDFDDRMHAWAAEYGSDYRGWEVAPAADRTYRPG